MILSPQKRCEAGRRRAATPARFALALLLAAAAMAATSGLVAPSTAAAIAAPAAQAGFEDWYPRDIQPPPGTRYPCALTALPPGLPGIPADEHRFINHIYALILRATQAKLVMLRELEGAAAAAAWAGYQRDTQAALRTLRAEPPPAGLAAFRDRVAAAIELQMTFFAKALDAHRHGQTLAQIFRIPEARAASARLQAAWAQMAARYPDWPAATRDSIYHHLCALDLF